MKYFPKKLTMTWIRNSYKEGSLTPEELAGEIVRRAEKYRDYNIWIVAPDLKRMMDYIDEEILKSGIFEKMLYPMQ